jgi:hypothetical protein
MEILAELARADERLHPTAYMVVETTDPESTDAGSA